MVHIQGTCFSDQWIVTSWITDPGELFWGLFSCLGVVAAVCESVIMPGTVSSVIKFLLWFKLWFFALHSAPVSLRNTFLSTVQLNLCSKSDCELDAGGTSLTYWHTQVPLDCYRSLKTSGTTLSLIRQDGISPKGFAVESTVKGHILQRNQHQLLSGGMTQVHFSGSPYRYFPN